MYKIVSDRLARRRRPESIRAWAHAGAHLLLGQSLPLDTALERAAIFYKVLQEMGADSSERQIALALGIYIVKDQMAKEEVITRRTKTRGLVDALAETPDGGDKARIMHFKGPEEAIDGALIGSVKKIHAWVDAIREGGVGALHTFSGKFISA